MGDIIGGIVGGIGSLIGGNSASKKEDEAAKTAMTGYNYLVQNPNNQTAQNVGTQAAVAGQGIQQAQQDLLTSPDANNPAFQNYLNSTGYQFQQQQGMDAITGSAAAKGIVNSGATAKALTAYGQGLAGQSFNNYLGQLGSLNGERQASANAGLQASTAIGNAGTTAGNNAGTFQAQAGQSQGTSQSQAANYFGGSLQSGINSGQLGNFFGSIF